MNVLKDKQTRTYESISRYAPLPFYYNTVDNKYIYGISKRLNNETEFTLHEVSTEDTLDSLALYYYGRPDYYWIIADFNRLDDSLIDLSSKLKTVKIPSISYIYYED